MSVQTRSALEYSVRITSPKSLQSKLPEVARSGVDIDPKAPTY